MLARFARLALIALTLGLLPEGVQAGQPFVPSWVKNDPAAKTVAMEIVADWSQVARYTKEKVRTDIMDLNGYWDGNLTLIVPTGWEVKIEFMNHAGVVRHSLMVTPPYSPSEMPKKLTAQDAVWGAYIDPPEGIFPQETAQLSFVARDPGNYFLACARQGHLIDGQWIALEVKDGIDHTMAVIHEDKFSSEDPPGRE